MSEHVEWMYREACVQFMKESRKLKRPDKGPWFQLASLIEDLFPEEVADYRKRMGIDADAT